MAIAWKRVATDAGEGARTDGVGYRWIARDSTGEKIP